MDPQQWRERQMQYDWWQKQQQGGGSNNGGGCGCLLLLLFIGVPVVLMLMSGCSPKLQENNLVKSANFISPLLQEVVL